MKAFRLAMVVGVFVLAAAAGIWGPELLQRKEARVLRLDPDPGCDLRAAPCHLALPAGGRVQLSIRPREIPPMQPLALEVRVEEMKVQAVEVEFAGVDMDMGPNRTQLQPRGSGEFGGTGVIPVCVRARMLWEARVVMDAEDGRLEAPFRFEVARR
ncbi:MAG: hypothetical protein ABFS23_05735 [Pseudomonadota bacterium]